MISWSGRVWRHIPAGSHPLDFGYILRARGRWNRAGIYGCLYMSLSRDMSLSRAGAIAEYRRLLARSGGNVRLRVREVVSIDVHQIEPILDLTTLDSLAEFGIDSLDHITADTDASVELCRAISDDARRRGAVGLLAPSAALEGAANLMVYHDGLAGGINIGVGPDREAILE